jgi:hypothetical protein
MYLSCRETNTDSAVAQPVALSLLQVTEPLLYSEIWTVKLVDVSYQYIS